jgi:hypothetical protein
MITIDMVAVVAIVLLVMMAVCAIGTIMAIWTALQTLLDAINILPERILNND